MIRLLLVLSLFFSFSMAIDKSAAIEAVKANPALLNTPQAQQALEEHGITKDAVLSKINGGKKDNTKISTKTIDNKIENVKNEKDQNTENDKKISFTISNPLKFQTESQLIKKVQRLRQYEKKVKLRRFGNKFFLNKNRISSSNLIVPDYYNINSGDSLSIILYGDTNKKYELKVDNYGNVNIPILGPINIANLTFAEAKKIISNKIKPTYPTSKILIKMNAYSSIQVSLTGNVKAPGIYNLSSISTIKDLLIAAHGFDKIGSMRNVYLKRDGKVLKIIDFYKLIKNGEVVDTTLLKNGDIIFVPKAEKLVKLSGAVNIPAIYELKKGEKLKDLINYAGGIKANGSSDYIKIKRFISNSSENFVKLQLHFIIPA